MRVELSSKRKRLERLAQTQEAERLSLCSRSRREAIQTTSLVVAAEKGLDSQRCSPGQARLDSVYQRALALCPRARALVGEPSCVPACVHACWDKHPQRRRRSTSRRDRSVGGSESSPKVLELWHQYGHLVVLVSSLPSPPLPSPPRPPHPHLADQSLLVLETPPFSSCCMRRLLAVL